MNKKSRNITIFVLVWLVINLFTAGYLELSPDESYYWLYGQKFDWGYFDHPPLIAVFNSVIDRYIYHTELSVRLLSVLSTAGYFYYLYKIIQPKNSTIFILLCTANLATHVFGFTSLPDTPLLLFSGAFFYYFEKYISEENNKNIIALCIVTPLLFYTKYHALLLILFSLIAFPAVFKRKSFYVILFVSLVLYAPHIYWQISHDYPSLKYHFMERNASEFRWIFIWDYLSSQVVFYGPFFVPIAVIALFKYANKLSVKDRLLKINFIGFLVFFLWSSNKGYVEVNWTLPALTCILYFAHLYSQKHKYGKQFVLWGGGLSLIIILILRIHLITPFIKTPFMDRSNDFRGHKELISKVENSIGDKKIVTTRYQEAGLLSYYTNSLVPSINLNGRKNQFNTWNLFSQLNGEPYYLLSDNVDDIEVSTSTGKVYTLGFHERLPAFSGVRLNNVILRKDSLHLKFDERFIKDLREKSPENATFLKIKIHKKDSENDVIKVLISKLNLSKKNTISFPLKKSLEKESYNIEILLYSANFGTWSEKWQQEIEVK